MPYFDTEPEVLAAINDAFDGIKRAVAAGTNETDRNRLYDSIESIEELNDRLHALMRNLSEVREITSTRGNNDDLAMAA